eukprot:363931-Chlamydomonas_euryale.AAC.11
MVHAVVRQGCPVLALLLGMYSHFAIAARSEPQVTPGIDRHRCFADSPRVTGPEIRKPPSGNCRRLGAARDNVRLAIDDGECKAEGLVGLGGVVDRQRSTWRDSGSVPGSHVPVGWVGLVWGGSGPYAVSCPL